MDQATAKRWAARLGLYWLGAFGLIAAFYLHWRTSGRIDADRALVPDLALLAGLAAVFGGGVAFKARLLFGPPAAKGWDAWIHPGGLAVCGAVAMLWATLIDRAPEPAYVPGAVQVVATGQP